MQPQHLWAAGHARRYLHPSVSPMKKSGRFTTVLALVGALTLSACVLINKFDKMEAVVHGRDVTFSLPDKDLAHKNAKYILYDIGVDKLMCDKDCVVWEMVRQKDSSPDAIEKNFVMFPIKYGVTLPNMETRVLKKLQKGRYSAGATFEIIDAGNSSRVKKVVSGFSIE